ncbi:deoxyribodipyrimidine photo-lyase [Streptomyces sp. H10-C2]|uniref:cryptochrome/photolyase family protein n=1 Tax=unclassified Streptomyces TaxID=2593676 RepID=UPI0024BAABAD|nr:MULTISPECIES: deoxyribodipyrimidine photo-lyase [unclassified Streptomyces]MDJ0346791.1 deoxyribodipyrimidine photo-lyase [Streptomyces sp. PH10-H1]MDJ0374379.1 deoxyribodipyrimidine photo-lyase [Streptomyces sp. H10-C2]
MSVHVVLFTGDLRLHDHPALRAALDSAEEVVPLFVRDRAIERSGFAVPNRLAFLADCLADLDAGLRERGGRLVVRSGDVVEQVCRVATEAGADELHLAASASRYAHDREERLRGALERQGCRLLVHDAVVHAVAPGTVTPAASDHFAVFTPYYRHWSRQPLRPVCPAPRAVRVPDDVGSEALPDRTQVAGTSPGLARGGEQQARRQLTTWLRGGIDAYDDRHDDLAADATSRLSPHLHFGTLSPVECVQRARSHGGPGAEAFVRQLAWRDFHHQVLAARPQAATADYRTRHDRWRGASADRDIAAWREGRTGFPIVDAAMRQLSHEGWMHNRGRLLTASFLTKTLYVDWRVGARHFLDLLVDGDVANNQLNWQWVAGTGTDTRPNRILNPMRQARRYDPDGAYVRRWVPELRDLDAPAIHQPWNLPGPQRAALRYPDPIVELADGADRFKQARARD